MGILGLGMMCLALPVAIAAFAFWVWMLVDCGMNEPSEGNDKVIWILVILLVPVPIGALIYFFARRPERIALYGK